MNRSLNLLAVCCFGIALVVPTISQAAAPPKKRPTAAHEIKLATAAPKDSSVDKILRQMGEGWRSAPGGGVTLTVYPGGVMGSEADTVRKMKAGQLHAALLSGVGLSEIDRSIDALQKMPMAFRSLEELDYVSGKLHPEIAASMRRKGFVVLFWADAGWVRYFSRAPVVTPADLKKTKLFQVAGEVVHQDIMKSAGFRPVPLEVNDLLTALKTGMVTAAPFPPTFAVAMQVHTEAKYMLELNWVPLVGALVVTEKAWNKLPVETQKALAQTAAGAGATMKAYNRNESDVAVAAMMKRGLIVQPVSPELESEWRREVERFYPRVRGEVVPAPMFDRVIELVTEFRRSAKVAERK
jgi:TRAP-type transport system periplasmic protein